MISPSIMTPKKNDIAEMALTQFALVGIVFLYTRILWLHNTWTYHGAHNSYVRVSKIFSILKDTFVIKLSSISRKLIWIISAWILW